MEGFHSHTHFYYSTHNIVWPDQVMIEEYTKDDIVRNYNASIRFLSM